MYGHKKYPLNGPFPTELHVEPGARSTAIVITYDQDFSWNTQLKDPGNIIMDHSKKDKDQALPSAVLRKGCWCLGDRVLLLLQVVWFQGLQLAESGQWPHQGQRRGHQEAGVSDHSRHRSSVPEVSSQGSSFFSRFFFYFILAFFRPLYLGYAWAKVPFKNDLNAAVYATDEFQLPGAVWRCEMKWNMSASASAGGGQQQQQLEQCEMSLPKDDPEMVMALA